MRFSKLTRLLCACIIATSLSLERVALAQTPQPPIQTEYISPEGFVVNEVFFTYFMAGGGVARYGQPITNKYLDKNLGLTVQYFEKARMEFHPGNPPAFQVQLGLIGQEVGTSQLPIPIEKIPAPNDPTCRYYVVTGHTVCHAFLEFYDQNGGLNMFGYPITEFIKEGNRVVQYFQRGRMEWHPERPLGQRVQLANLGILAFNLKGGDPLQGVPPFSGNPNGTPSPTPIPINALRVTANLADQVVPKNTQHSFKVTVRDQLNRPVAGAGVTLEVYYPSGLKTFTLPLTEANGTARFNFNAGSDPEGTLVRVRVIVVYSNLTGITRTDYLIWYQ
jgi:hypothetical protein